MMRSVLRRIAAAISLAIVSLLPVAVHAQGTTPLALAQQSDVNGAPLAGCLVYFYQAGTVSTPQNSYQDFGLSILNPNPLACDQTGRVPMHWLANGLIHLRLTDATGIVQLDTTMQVLGPSTGGGGGGGGGGSVDPTTIAATGDIKFRLTAETLTGWIKLNGQTIGSALSGASQRANADTQNLFVYLWTNCPNGHCPVVGGRGSTALADFNANKKITLPDMRDAAPIGRDCMENTCAAGLLSSNITSGGGDGVDTSGAGGGAANITIAQTNLPAVPPTGTVTIGGSQALNSLFTSGGGSNIGLASGSQTNINTQLIVQGSNFTGTFAGNNLGSGTAFADMGPFRLGTWYEKL